ncbi:unnamed protein product [Adineta ricciae]|nr:unnamed protein product [Adineta ricciae]
MYGRVRNEETMSYLTWIWLWKLSKLLFFLNFTANPIIYNILSTKFRRSCRRLFQIHRSISLISTSSRKASISSYLYSSIYKNRRRQSSLRNNQSQLYRSHRSNKPISLSRNIVNSNPTISLMSNETNNISNNGREQIAFTENDNRDLETIANKEEIPISAINSGKRSQHPFQVLCEEDEEYESTME